MKVRAKLYSDLKETYAPGNPDGIVELLLGERSTVNNVLDSLRVDEREIGFIVVNGNKVQKDYPVSDGEVVHIFALVAGG